MSQGGGHDLLTGPGGHTYKKPGSGTGAGVTSVTAGAGLANSGTATDPVLDVGAGTGITVAADTVAVDQAFAPTWTGAHVWDTEDNGTTTVPVQVAVQHRNNAAGTPAAGYGIGLAMKLDSAARTLRTAVELDAVWSTATDGAEVSSLALKTLIAGAATETARFGTGAALPDVDFPVSLGRALIDSRVTDRAYFSHRDMTSTSQYALQQAAAGGTQLNAPTGQSLILTNNATQKMKIDTTGIAFYATATTVALQTVTGSRAANAALADLLTKLATLGLVVDSTTA